MGSVEEGEGYSVPDETQKIFLNGILNNPLIPALPWELKAAGQHVRFTGNARPSIPINWRFAESAAALKAFEASMLNVLRYRKYGSKVFEISIDTDHASLFVMSPLLIRVVEDGETKDTNFFLAETQEKYGIRNCDLHRASASLHRSLATNIYQTKDGKYYHIHGSMNPEPTLTALNMDLEGNANADYDTVAKQFQEIVSQHSERT